MQQQHDRSVPLGEVLVRMGVVSREDLQTALARKMGYPLVDVDAFPVEAQALRRLKYGVAARLRVMPLLISDGRLIVALDDPSRRAAVDEVEFNADMKVIPVLGARPLDRGRAAQRLRQDRLGRHLARRDDRAAPIAYEPDFSALPPRRRRPTSWSRRSRRKASSGSPAKTTSRSSSRTTRWCACSTT